MVAIKLPSFSKVEKILDLVHSGLESKVPHGTKLPMGGTVVPVPEALGKVGHFRSFFTEAREKHHAFLTAVEARRAVGPEVAKFLTELKAALIAVLGAGSPELANLGFPPRRKPSPLSAEAHLAQVARLRE